LSPIIDIINTIDIDLIRRGGRGGEVLLHPTKVIPLHGIENSWSTDVAVIDVVAANAIAHEHSLLLLSIMNNILY
jgi:hypothetical protein